MDRSKEGGFRSRGGTTCHANIYGRGAGGIPTDAGLKLGTSLLAYEPASRNEDGWDLAQVEGVKHQEVVYHRGRIKDRIPFSPNNFKHVDLQTALRETLSLSCACDALRNNGYALVVLYNWTNQDSVDILRTGEDMWNISAPVFCVDPRASCKHITHLDTRRLEDMIKMFFEGDDWFGITRFHFDSQTFEYELGMDRSV